MAMLDPQEVAARAYQSLGYFVIEGARARMIVIDANVAAKWLLPEPGSEAAVALQEGPQQLFAPDLIRLEVAAAIAGAAVFAGSSLHGSITALAYSRPFAILNMAAESKLDGFARLTGHDAVVATRADCVSSALNAALHHDGRGSRLAALQQRVDAHFDRVATLVAAAARPDVDGRDERRAVAGYVQGLHHELTRVRSRNADLEVEAEATRPAIDDARRQAGDAADELARLRATRTLRWSALPRRLYARLRGR